MKAITAVVILFAAALSSAVEAATISKDGYMGCRTKADFSALITAATQKDKQSFLALANSGRCVRLVAGQRISIVDTSLFGGTAEILYQGVRLFTVMEAINP